MISIFVQDATDALGEVDVSYDLYQLVREDQSLISLDIRNIGSGTILVNEPHPIALRTRTFGGHLLE